MANVSDDAVKWASRMADEIKAKPNTYLTPQAERAFAARLRGRS